eukprot:14661170-Alexandrium_andersonii.AAC.1
METASWSDVNTFKDETSPTVTVANLCCRARGMAMKSIWDLPSLAWHVYTRPRMAGSVLTKYRSCCLTNSKALTPHPQKAWLAKGPTQGWQGATRAFQSPPTSKCAPSGRA